MGKFFNTLTEMFGNPNKGKYLFGKRTADKLKGKSLTFVEDEKPNRFLEKFTGTSFLPLEKGEGKGGWSQKRLLQNMPESGALLDVSGYVPTTKSKRILHKINSYSKEGTKPFDKGVERAIFKKSLPKTVDLKNLSDQQAQKKLKKTFSDNNYILKPKGGAQGEGIRWGFEKSPKNLSGYVAQRVMPTRYVKMMRGEIKRRPLMGSLQDDVRVHVINGQVIPYGTSTHAIQRERDSPLYSLSPKVIYREIASKFFRPKAYREAEAEAQKIINALPKKYKKDRVYGFDLSKNEETGKYFLVESNPTEVNGAASGFITGNPFTRSAVRGAIEGKLPRSIKITRTTAAGTGAAGVGALVLPTNNTPKERKNG